jgi:hypothetical protein
MFKRIFTFGCSFTKHSWPSWADIMGWDLEIEFQNWGMAGLGNVGIFHRIVECDLKNNFNDKDLIVVLWSHWNREDRYSNQQWIARGNIFNHNFYDKKFIQKYWSLENDIIKNSTAIISANKIANINFQGHIRHPSKFETNEKTYSDYELELYNFYKKFYSCNNLFPIKLIPMYEKNYTKFCHHPSILLHLIFLKSIVYPSLGLTIKESTENLCKKIEKDIIKSFISAYSLEKRSMLIDDIIRNKYKKEYNKQHGF